VVELNLDPLASDYRSLWVITGNLLSKGIYRLPLQCLLNQLGSLDVWGRGAVERLISRSRNPVFHMEALQLKHPQLAGLLHLILQLTGVGVFHICWPY